MREYYDELMQGHFVFMVQTESREEGDEVWYIMQNYDARRPTFYGRWVVEKVA